MLPVLRHAVPVITHLYVREDSEQGYLFDIAVERNGIARDFMTVISFNLFYRELLLKTLEMLKNTLKKSLPFMEVIFLILIFRNRNC